MQNNHGEIQINEDRGKKFATVLKKIVLYLMRQRGGKRAGEKGSETTIEKLVARPSNNNIGSHDILCACTNLYTYLSVYQKLLHLFLFALFHDSHALARVLQGGEVCCGMLPFPLFWWLKESKGNRL